MGTKASRFIDILVECNDFAAFEEAARRAKWQRDPRADRWLQGFHMEQAGNLIFIRCRPAVYAEMQKHAGIMATLTVLSDADPFAKVDPDFETLAKRDVFAKIADDDAIVAKIRAVRPATVTITDEGGKVLGTRDQGLNFTSMSSERVEVIGSKEVLTEVGKFKRPVAQGATNGRPE